MAERNVATVADRVCSVQGCGRKRYKRDWCAACYREWLRTKADPRPFPSTCEICEGPLRGVQGRRVRRDSRFCSQTCASRDWFLRNREQQYAAIASWRERNPERAQDIALGCQRRWKERVAEGISPERKKCANPPCDKMIPLAWTWCRDRNCQSARGSQEAWDAMVAHREAFYREQEERSAAQREAARAQRAAQREAILTDRRATRQLARDRKRIKAAFRHGSVYHYSEHWQWEHVPSSDHSDLSDYLTDWPDTAAEVRALVGEAPIIPADWWRRCAEGELRLVVDDDGVRFVVPRRSDAEAVPWRDFAGPIPSLAIVSAGKMAHRTNRRKRAQSAGWSRGHGSKKSKRAA